MHSAWVKIKRINAINLFMGKRVVDIDLIVTAILFYLTIPVIVYVVIFNISRMPFLWVPLVFILIILTYIASRSIHRYTTYEVTERSILMKNGTLLFTKNLRIDRKDVKAVHEVDPYRWTWMKGSNDKLPIFFLFRDGRKYVEIKNPPKQLTKIISETWEIELKKSSRAGFMRDHIENTTESGSKRNG